MKIKINDEEKVRRIALREVPLVGDIIAKNLLGRGNATAVFKEKKGGC